MKIKKIDTYQCDKTKAFFKKLDNHIHFKLGHCIEIDLRGIKYGTK